jgi:uncharacterized cupredoxin-like copper-binding protein
MPIRRFGIFRGGRFFILLAILVLSFEVVACRSTNDQTGSTTNPTNQQPSPVGATTAPTLPPLTSNAAEFTIQAMDYSFAAPQQVPMGLVSFMIQNNGKEQHHGQIFRLKDGKTFADLTAVMAQGESAVAAVADAAGGPGIVEPGTTGLPTTMTLQPGQHALLCFIPSPDGTPHLAKGMVQGFNVAQLASAITEEPTADLTISMRDFSYLIQGNVVAGRQTWKVTNDGGQVHEAVLMRIAPGRSPQEASAYLAQQNPSGPPPFIGSGGVQALDRGKTAFVVEDMQPGQYLLICYVTDPASGRRHTQLGMITGFAIQ